jgi:hypothetical protein
VNTTVTYVIGGISYPVTLYDTYVTIGGVTYQIGDKVLLGNTRYTIVGWGSVAFVPVVSITPSSAVGSNTVLSWVDSSNNPADTTYVITYSVSGGGTYTTNISGGTYSWNTNQAPGTSVSYTIVAKVFGQTDSESSNTVTIVTPSVPVLSTISGSKIVSWTGTEPSYKVYRVDTSTNTYTLLATVSQNSYDLVQYSGLSFPIAVSATSSSGITSQYSSTLVASVAFDHVLNGNIDIGSINISAYITNAALLNTPIATVKNILATYASSFFLPPAPTYLPVTLTNVNVAQFVSNTFNSYNFSGSTVNMYLCAPNGYENIGISGLTTNPSIPLCVAGSVGITNNYVFLSTPNTTTSILFTASGCSIAGITYNLGDLVPFGPYYYRMIGTDFLTFQYNSVVPVSAPAPAPGPAPAPAPGPSTGPVVVPCFLENTPVLTPDGYKKISKLAEGDILLTGDGRSVEIRRVLHTRVVSGHSTNPYIIPKGLYGATKQLLISPNHKVQTENGMIEARLLGLQQEHIEEAHIDYYNIELPSWATDTMVVSGVVVESLAPVRRIVMTMAQFKDKIKAQYGEITPEILEKIQKTCCILEGGYIEVPAMVSSKTSTQ